MQGLWKVIHDHRRLSVVVGAIFVVALLGCRLTGALPGEGGPSMPEDVTTATEESEEPSEPTVTTDTPKPTEPAQQPQPTELVFNVKVQAEDGKPRFEVETNLPDGMLVTFTLRDEVAVLGQSEAAVGDGFATAGPFSRDGEPYPPGEYVLHISSPPLSMQPDGVQEQLGENGEGYQGEHIAEGRVGFETTFVVPAGQPEGWGEREEHMAFLEDHLAYLEGKLAGLLEAAEDETLDWRAWSTAWNEDLEQHKEAFREAFGANISEYTGHCQLAFFHVAEAYADIFLLWQRYNGFITGQRDGAELDASTEAFRHLLDEAQAEIAACREG